MTVANSERTRTNHLAADEPVASVPPLVTTSALRPATSSSAGRRALAWSAPSVFAGMLIAILGAHWALTQAWPIPPCGFRQLTGWPCATCGTTRALAALAQLDFWRAFRLNPLAVLVCGGLVGWLGFWLKRGWGTRKVAAGIPRWLTGRRGFCLAAAVWLANWIYVLATQTP